MVVLGWSVRCGVANQCHFQTLIFILFISVASVCRLGSVNSSLAAQFMESWVRHQCGVVNQNHHQTLPIIFSINASSVWRLGLVKVSAAQVRLLNSWVSQVECCAAYPGPPPDAERSPSCCWLGRGAEVKGPRCVCVCVCVQVRLGR